MYPIHNVEIKRSGFLPEHYDGSTAMMGSQSPFSMTLEQNIAPPSPSSYASWTDTQYEWNSREDSSISDQKSSSLRARTPLRTASKRARSMSLKTSHNSDDELHGRTSSKRYKPTLRELDLLKMSWQELEMQRMLTHCHEVDVFELSLWCDEKLRFYDDDV